jgi:hypothetical protein
MSSHLRAHLSRVNGILLAMYDVIVDAIFDIGTGVRDAVEPFGIGFVLREQ